MCSLTGLQEELGGSLPQLLVSQTTLAVSINWIDDYTILVLSKDSQFNRLHYLLYRERGREKGREREGERGERGREREREEECG